MAAGAVLRALLALCCSAAAGAARLDQVVVSRGGEGRAARVSASLIPADRITDFWPRPWKGAYTVGRTLSSGGFGQVVRAEVACRDDEGEGSFHVAVKTQAVDDARDGGVLSMLMYNEHVALAMFSGPPFITSYHWDRYWYRIGRAPKRRAMITAMELVEGPNLEVLLAGKCDVGTMLKLFCELLLGIGTMYEVGFVHRDIKPDNIMVMGDCASLDGCHIRIIDFGCACTFRPAANSSAIPCDLGVAGTPAYSPPEVWRPRKLTDETPTWSTGTADVWSAGLVLYRMLCNGSFPLGTPNKGARTSTWRGRQGALVHAREDACLRSLEGRGLAGWGLLLEDMLANDPQRRIAAPKAFAKADALARRQNLTWGLGATAPSLPACFKRPLVRPGDIVKVPSTAKRPGGPAAVAGLLVACICFASSL